MRIPVCLLCVSVLLHATLGARGEEPLRAAEAQFLQQLNSMEGIEIVGGPFRAGEHYSFGGDSGYFVLAPETPVPGLDQRLSVQTKRLEITVRTNLPLPIAASPPAWDIDLSAERRRALLGSLAAAGFAEEKDEVTLFDDGSVQARRVNHLPLVSVRLIDEEQLGVLLGAQLWQGIPLVKAGFDRTRGNFDITRLLEGFVPRQPHEFQYRAVPMTPAQTFFAEPGLPPQDWEKLLARLSRLDQIPTQIIAAQVLDKIVTLSLDYRQPPLPSICVALKHNTATYQVDWAVEIRAEFPRPAIWWSFFPMLERPAAGAIAGAAEKLGGALQINEARLLASIILRLRGVGAPVSLAWDGQLATVKTAHNGWRGYDLTFRKVANQWRLAAVTQWTS